MNAPANVTKDRRPLLASLSVLLLLLAAAPAVSAQDDDWGLPKTINGSNGNGNSGGNSANGGGSGGGTQSLTVTDLLVWAELLPGTDPEVGSLQLDKPGEEPTDVLVPETSGLAEVAAQDAAQPVALADLDDGARLQGDLEVRPNELLQASLLAPEQAAVSVALLVVDDGSSSLAAMLDAVRAGSAPAGIRGHLVLGTLLEIDLALLAGLAAQASGLGSHLSVVIASLDAGGELHLSGARVATSGDGTMEVVTR